MLLVLAVVGVIALAARAEVDRDTYRSRTWGVEMVVPADWELTEQQSYPGILVSAMGRQGGGRMTLAAQTVEAGETARHYAEVNRATLLKLGYRVEPLTAHASGAILLRAETPSRKRRIRQAYLVRETRAFILTLAYAIDGGRSHERAFDDTLRSIVLKRPAGDEATSSSTGADAGPPASAPSSED
jgi:hypothetical protein